MSRGLTWGMALWALLGSGLIHARTQCSPPTMDAHAQVQSVVDGDTVRLEDRTLVRLIGINTPEINYDGGPSEPLAQAAKEFLQQQLNSQQTVGLVYGQERHDRHGRTLAHVFVEREGSTINVQQALLKKGLAHWVIVAPNTGFLPCYQAAEADARNRRLGVWHNAYFQPKDAGQPEALHPGFQLLRGKVTDVFQTRHFHWLKFNDTVALRIAPKDIHNFNEQELRALQGKTVVARGWLFQYRSKNRKRLTMQISHPASLEVQNEAVQNE